MNTFFKRYPLLISLVGNTVKTASADIIAQKYLENGDEVDLKRLSVFTTFGLVYLGGWQHFMFNNLFVKCEKIMTMAKYKQTTQSGVLTFLDLGVHTPLLYYPSFYSIKGYLENKTATEIISTYKNNISSDLLAMWKLWIPAQMVNFTFIPIHYRMPFITSVSFGWTMILSFMRGKKFEDDKS